MKIINLLPKHYIEHEYFNKMILFLDNKVFEDKTIFISHDYNSLPEYGDNIIAILTAGDETGNPPVYYKNIEFVFKHHLDSDNIGNVYHIPLPYPNNFCGNYKKDIVKRKYDVFFSGCKRSSRNDFVKAMNSLKKRKDINVCIKITGKFMSGFPIKQYSEIMSDSKIVLNPRGWIRNECIRFTEAVRCGCMIISEEQPNTESFNNCPYELISNWNNVNKKIDKLLSNNITDIHNKIKISWDKYFSPQAVSNKINNIVWRKNVNK